MLRCSYNVCQCIFIKKYSKPGVSYRHILKVIVFVMAAATVILSSQPFRLSGVDTHLSISDATSDQKVEGDFDLEMMMLDGYISQNQFLTYVFSKLICPSIVHQELASSPG
jgi:hypothetical protein